MNKITNISVSISLHHKINISFNIDCHLIIYHSRSQKEKLFNSIKGKAKFDDKLNKGRKQFPKEENSQQSKKQTKSQERC